MGNRLGLERIIRAAATLLLLAGLSVPSAIAGAAPAPPAAQHNLTGVWTGSYSYPDGRAPVEFLVILKEESNGKLIGALREPNTFTNASDLFLGAWISGAVKSGQVLFTKTYDGTAGQSHSVDYKGTVNWKTRVIDGQWSLNGVIGKFRMADHN